MATAASPTGGEKKEDDRKKLTKALSTKVSKDAILDSGNTPNFNQKFRKCKTLNL